MDKTLKKDFIRIGFSGAASWAWGTSLIMGQQIAQEKGLVAWIIWAVCNSLTLALLGFLFKKKIISKEIFDRKEAKVIALIIQLFCLLVQLNFINQQFLKIIGNPLYAYIITVAIGFIFTLIVFKKGLPTSINTDIVQWLGAIVSIIVIIAIGLITHAPLQHFVSTTPSGVLWGVWSGLILFAGPIGDVQHWQRVESDKSKKAYYLAAVLFAMYMLLILGMAFFQFSKLMNIILLITVLCITTSTIDSIAVATHEIKNKTVGTIVSLLICLTWGLFIKIGMIDLWSSFGVIRFAFAVGILLFPLCLKGKTKIVIPVSILSMAALALFTILGQINVTNIAGIVCMLVAVIILIYTIVLSVVRRKKVK